jgi:hypothetical protein
MSLTYTELESVTNDYFLADNKKAIDIYFNGSFLMNRFMEQKKGVYQRPPGGENIRVPLMYDGQESGFYLRGEALSSDDRESINAAHFHWKHAFGNATIYRPDELKNAGAYAEVQLVNQKLEGAQLSVRKDIAKGIFLNNSDTVADITGLTACCFGAATVAYGGIIENDLVSSDSTKPWKAVNTTTAAGIQLSTIRTLRSSAKISDGPGGKPDVGITTEILFNIFNGLLQPQQRFTDTDTAKAGFTHLVFEGMIISADDFCPSGYFFALNSKYYGWAIHKEGLFARTPWGGLENSTNPVAGKTMKIFWDGNQIVTNRKAHAGQSGLS